MDSWIGSIKLSGKRLDSDLARAKVQEVLLFFFNLFWEWVRDLYRFASDSSGFGLPPSSAYKEWDQPMRDYIEAIRAGKGDGNSTGCFEVPVVDQSIWTRKTRGC